MGSYEPRYTVSTVKIARQATFPRGSFWWGKQTTSDNKWLFFYFSSFDNLSRPCDNFCDNWWRPVDALATPGDDLLTTLWWQLVKTLVKTLATSGGYLLTTSLNSLWTVGWTLNHKQWDVLFLLTIVCILTKNCLDAKNQIVCPYFVTCNKNLGRPFKHWHTTKNSIQMLAIKRTNNQSVAGNIQTESYAIVQMCMTPKTSPGSSGWFIVSCRFLCMRTLCALAFLHGSWELTISDICFT